jgi:hypothetical protein
MDYNWVETFKRKTITELYEIASGRSFLPDGAVAEAKKELLSRGIDFNDTAKIKKKIEVESEIGEINYKDSLIHKTVSYRKTNYFRGFITGILMTVFFTLNLIFNYSHKGWLHNLGALLFTLAFSVLFYFLNRRQKMREKDK